MISLYHLFLPVVTWFPKLAHKTQIYQIYLSTQKSYFLFSRFQVDSSAVFATTLRLHEREKLEIKPNIFQTKPKHTQTTQNKDIYWPLTTFTNKTKATRCYKPKSNFSKPNVSCFVFNFLTNWECYFLFILQIFRLNQYYTRGKDLEY